MLVDSFQTFPDARSTESDPGGLEPEHWPVGSVSLTTATPGAGMETSGFTGSPQLLRKVDPTSVSPAARAMAISVGLDALAG